MKGLTKRRRAELQRLIDPTTAAANAFQREQAKLMEFCGAEYGREPGDIDADQIIDGVLGGCGESCGMDADEFDEIMRPGDEA